MTPDDKPELLAAGYALGSLTPAEAAAYEALLTRSPSARAEAEEFQQVAAAPTLDASPVTPPAQLKARILAQIATTPQLSAASDTPLLPDELADTGDQDAPAPGPAALRARARATRRPTIVMAAAAAAIVLFAGGAIVGGLLGGGASLQQAQSPTLAQIIAAPDSQRASVPIAGGGTATLVWSGELGKSALFVDGLDAPPADKTYELWYMRGETAASAGILQIGQDGTTWQVLNGAMRGGDSVGVTVEPTGGSATPSGTPIIVIQS
jgi:anti-sigma-K factor RskA